MELGFIEGLRRRWDVLGIEVGATDGKAKEMPLDLEGTDAADVSDNQMQVDDSDATRRAIMDGAIVKSVISSAANCECLVPVCLCLALVAQRFSV